MVQQPIPTSFSSTRLTAVDLEAMLRVWRASGHELPPYAVDGLCDVKALKQDLQLHCGQPRFRQRLLHAGAVLDDGTSLDAPMHLQMVLLPLISASDDQRNELIDAVHADLPSRVEEILQRPQDPDLTGTSEHSGSQVPLCIAASQGFVETARLLLEAGANKDQEGGHGHPDQFQEYSTPLILACQYGHLEMVRLLLEVSADVALCEMAVNATALIRAAEGNYVDIAQLLLDARASLNQTQRRGRTALVCACFKQHTAVAHLLVEALADLNLADNIGMTALSWTSCAGHVDVVRLLLEANADHELASEVGLTALACASCMGHLEVVRLLLARESHDIPSRVAALVAASNCGRAEVVELLLRSADSQLLNNGGWTAYMCAARQGHARVVASFLEAGMDRNLSRSLDSSVAALVVASGHGHVEVVERLLETRVDEALASPAALEAIACASHYGFGDVVHRLLEAGVGQSMLGSTGAAAIACICAATQGKIAIVKWLVVSCHSTTLQLVGNEPDYLLLSLGGPDC